MKMTKQKATCFFTTTVVAVVIVVDVVVIVVVVIGGVGVIGVVDGRHRRVRVRSRVRRA